MPSFLLSQGVCNSQIPSTFFGSLVTFLPPKSHYVLRQPAVRSEVQEFVPQKWKQVPQPGHGDRGKTLNVTSSRFIISAELPENFLFYYIGNSVRQVSLFLLNAPSMVRRPKYFYLIAQSSCRDYFLITEVWRTDGAPNDLAAFQ